MEVQLLEYKLQTLLQHEHFRKLVFWLLSFWACLCGLLLLKYDLKIFINLNAFEATLWMLQWPVGWDFFSRKQSNTLPFIYLVSFFEVVEAEIRSLELEHAQQHARYLKAFMPDNFTKPGGNLSVKIHYIALFSCSVWKMFCLQKLKLPFRLPILALNLKFWQVTMMQLCSMFCSHVSIRKRWFWPNYWVVRFGFPF